MAFEWRDNQDGLYGRLSTGLAINETTLASPEIVNLPAMAPGQTERYVPIVLYTPQDTEIVWAYEHVAGDPTCKIARGKQGTNAQQWVEQSDWGCMTTDWDLLPSMTMADLATIEPFRGMRVYVTDEGRVVERAGSKWVPSASVANPGEIGPGTVSPAQTGTFFPPESAVIEMRAGASVGVTDVNGERIVYYRTPFPNATIASPCVNASIAGADLIVIMARWAYGFRYRLLNSSTKAPRNNVVSSVEYVAVGF